MSIVAGLVLNFPPCTLSKRKAMSTEGLRSVQLRKNLPPMFAGEICGFPIEKANRLIANREAYAIGSDGKPIITPDPPKKPRVDPADAAAKPQEPAASAPSGVNPFTVDGLTEAVANSLNAAKLFSPGDVRDYVAAGKKLESLAGIGKTKAQLITSMYCDGQLDLLDEDQQEEPSAEPAAAE